MAPAPFFRVVRLAAGLSTLRTGKRTATFEVDSDLELPLDGVEFIAGHVPGLGQTESEGEEVFAVHVARVIARPCDGPVRPTHSCTFGWKWTGVKPAGWRRA